MKVFGLVAYHHRVHAHWSTLASTDFFRTEVWTPKGLVTIYTLFVIRLKTRRVHIVKGKGTLDLVSFDDIVVVP